MTRQAASSRFRRDTALEAVARVWPASGLLGRMRRMLKPVFDAVLGFRTAGALESRLPGGEIVRVRPAWRHLSWNPDEYSAFRSAIRPGDVVIDAGANAGAYALLFAQWVGPGGRVYAFEPDPRAFTALEDHIALNGLNDRVVAVRAAVAGEAGRVRLRLDAANGLSRIAHGGDDDPRDVDAAAISIDEFCGRANIRPSVIKIDVEGAELAALRGARRTIASAGPALRLYVEMHPAVWRDFGITPDDIVRECEGSRLTLETLDGTRDGLWSVDGMCLRLRPDGGGA